MIIKSLRRTEHSRGIVALTHEYVYNAWINDNILHFYVLSNDNICDVLKHISARVENGEIHAIIDDDVAITFYSHDELINTIKFVFHDSWNDIITIIETLLYVE